MSVSDLEKTPDPPYSPAGQSPAELPSLFPDSSLTAAPTTLGDRPPAGQNSGQKRKLWIPLGATAIALVAAGLGWHWLQSNPGSSAGSGPGGPPGGAPPALPVQLATVRVDRLEDSSDFVGSLESRRSVSLRTKVDGRIEQVLVREGDQVRAGQPLFILDSAEVQAEVLQNRAAADSARASLAELQAGNRPEEIAEAEARVSRARADVANAVAKLHELQAGSRPQEIAEAQARVTRSQAAVAEVQARLILTQERLRRNRALAAEGVVPRDSLDGFVQAERSTRAEVELARAEVAEARKALERIRSGNRIQTIAAAQAEVASKQASLAEAQQAADRIRKGPRSEEIARAQSQVAEATARASAARVRLNDTTVVAPFAGTVGAIPAKKGDYVEKNTELATVNEAGTLELSLAVPIERASQLGLGLPVQILGPQGGAIASGVIDFIAPNANPQSQTLLAKARFDNNGGRLRNQQLVQARLVWAVRSGVLVPVNAISRLGGQAFVFVAQAAPALPAAAPGAKPAEGPPPPPPGTLVAHQRPVKLGAIQGNAYQVLEGLQAGDRIVVSGGLNLREGAAIAPAPPPGGSPAPSP